MTAKGPSIAPRQSSVAQSPIAIAGSPPSSASAGSTPRSVASPDTLHNNNNNTAASPPNNTANRTLTTKNVTSIMTSKEWVLPPRPKPGRKPSVDTPASKRKAQNRAAQRAFRERRATRVQELEEKLMEVEKEKDIKEMALINTINKLKAENNFLSKSMDQIRQEMAMFRASQEEMRSQLPPNQIQQQQQQQQNTAPLPQQQPQQQLPSKRHSSNTSSSSYSQLSLQPAQPQQQLQAQAQYYTGLNNGQHISPSNNVSPTGSSYSLQQISPAPSADSPPNNTLRNNYHSHGLISRNNSSNSNSTQHTLTPVSHNNTPDKLFPTLSNSKGHSHSNNGVVDSSEFDCGVCIKDECLCESVGLKEPRKTEADRELENQLNSIKPQPAVSLRRKRKTQSIDDVEEIDFTRQFATKAKPMPNLNKLRKQEQQATNTTVVSVTKHNHTQHQQRSKSADKIDTSDFNEDSPMENCGFCSDDTPCVCREAAKEAARLNASLNGPDNIILEEEEEEEDQQQTHAAGEQNADHNTLPPLKFNLTSNNSNTKMALPVMHPGPSVEIRDITNLTPGAVPTVITRANQASSSSESSQGKQQQQQQIAEEVVNSNEDGGAAGGGCTGNPGTCQQCQMDPLSTLFCTTVASKNNDSSIRPNLSRSNSKSTLSLNFGPNTPGASGANNSNSRSNGTSNNNHNNAPSPIPPPLIASNSSNNVVASPGGGLNGFPALLPTTPGSSASNNDTNNDATNASTGGGMFIPCADAYKTLSRHKKFNSVDFSTLVGKLTTRGMQVEVQSVANVLRELDRRLYN